MPAIYWCDYYNKECLLCRLCFGLAMDFALTFSFVGLYCGFAKGWLFTRATNKVCYGSLGCFSKRYPFTNTQGLLPRPPDVIGVKFLLFTRNSTHKYEELVLTDGEKSYAWKSFSKLKQIKIIIHGYMDSVGKQWVKDMVNELLKHDDYSVIVVDWGQGARELIYLQAVANIRVVGAHVAQFITVLKNVYRIEPTDLHLIGHSLGAHAAGYAGEYLESIGRITGLDPAGPSFEKTDPRVRLDPTDAIFVDTIHTDTEDIFNLGFGLKQAAGTVDFYPNGGIDQPGCTSSYFAQLSLLFSGDFELRKTFACSHLRALDFFTESINSNCSFVSYPCELINKESSKNCKSCKTGCGIMGFHTNTSMLAGMYFLETDSENPYCNL